MKLLTLNTWQERGPWEERWSLIFEGLEKYDPDIVALQEVFNLEWAEKVKKKAGFPFLVTGEEKSGLIFLSHFAVERSECLRMKTQSPTEPYARYALFAGIAAGNEKMSLFNTHLSWRTPETDIRQAQAEELLNYVSDKSGGEAVAVMGDFNAVPESPEVNMMIRQGGFEDAYASRHSDSGWTWNNRNPYAASSSVKMPDRRIDYIFYRPGKKLLTKLEAADLVFTEANPENVYPSDHFGILAVF